MEDCSDKAPQDLKAWELRGRDLKAALGRRRGRLPPLKRPRGELENRMRKSISTIVVIPVVLLVSCSKPSQESQALPTPIPTATPTPTPVPTPIPTPSASPVAIVTPRPANLAPDGVLFLVQRVSITTDSGVLGIAPGTKVQRLATTATGFTVSTADGTRFDVTSDQVTNDLNAAYRAGYVDAVGKQIASQRLQSEAATAAAASAAQQAAADAAMRKAMQTPTPRKVRVTLNPGPGVPQPPVSDLQRMGGG